MISERRQQYSVQQQRRRYRVIDHMLNTIFSTWISARGPGVRTRAVYDQITPIDVAGFCDTSCAVATNHEVSHFRRQRAASRQRAPCRSTPSRSSFVEVVEASVVKAHNLLAIGFGVMVQGARKQCKVAKRSYVSAAVNRTCRARAPTAGAVGSAVLR